MRKLLNWWLRWEYADDVMMWIAVLCLMLPFILHAFGFDFAKPL